MRLEDKAEDLLKKAMECETVEELLKLAKGQQHQAYGTGSCEAFRNDEPGNRGAVRQ